MTSIRKAKKRFKKLRKAQNELINAMARHIAFMHRPIEMPLTMLTNDVKWRSCPIEKEKYTWNVLGDGKIMR